jgi:hypothetical protein
LSTTPVSMPPPAVADATGSNAVTPSPRAPLIGLDHHEDLRAQAAAHADTNPDRSKISGVFVSAPMAKACILGSYEKRATGVYTRATDEDISEGCSRAGAADEGVAAKRGQFRPR